jgi:hypothetical protein
MLLKHFFIEEVSAIIHASFNYQPLSYHAIKTFFIDQTKKHV